MASASSGDDDGMVSGINVTPLVDVCLVLMVILMVTARLIDQQAMPLDLPKSANGQAIQDQFALNLHANGQTEVNDKRLAREDDIKPMAKEALAKNPELRTIIRADSAVSHGRVMHIIDLLKDAGISKIAFGVQQKTDESAAAPSGSPVAPPPPATGAPTPAPSP